MVQKSGAKKWVHDFLMKSFLPLSPEMVQQCNHWRLRSPERLRASCGYPACGHSFEIVPTCTSTSDTFSVPCQDHQFAACGWCNPNPTSHDLDTADTSADSARLDKSASVILPSNFHRTLLYARSLDFFYEICFELHLIQIS